MRKVVLVFFGLMFCSFGFAASSEISYDFVVADEVRDVASYVAPSGFDFYTAVWIVIVLAVVLFLLRKKFVTPTRQSVPLKGKKKVSKKRKIVRKKVSKKKVVRKKK